MPEGRQYPDLSPPALHTSTHRKAQSPALRLYLVGAGQGEPQMDSTAYPVLAPAEHGHQPRDEYMPKTVGQALAPLACWGKAKDLSVLHIYLSGAGNTETRGPWRPRESEEAMLLGRDLVRGKIHCWKECNASCRSEGLLVLLSSAPSKARPLHMRNQQEARVPGTVVPRSPLLPPAWKGH